MFCLFLINSSSVHAPTDRHMLDTGTFTQYGWHTGIKPASVAL